MAGKKVVEWAVLGGEGALCKRCGGTEPIPKMPISVDALAHWMNYFAERHRFCKEEEKPPETP